jgi:hypothetical protein
LNEEFPHKLNIRWTRSLREHHQPELVRDGSNKKKILVSGYLKREAKAVAYWMHRDQRVSTALFNFSQILEHNTLLAEVVSIFATFSQNFKT